MVVYEVSKGHYGYNFMYKGDRHCRSFKGKTKDEVATIEMEHRLSLFKGTSISTATSIYYWEDAVRDYKVYAEAHYT